MEIEYYLIKPVQRITKYDVLIERFLKSTWEDHPDYALLAKAHQEIRQQLAFINSTYIPARNRKVEVANLAKELKMESLVTPSRELLRKEEFTNSSGSKGKLRVFLMNDMVLVCSVKRRLKFKGSIPYSRLWYCSGVDRDPRGFYFHFHFHFYFLIE
jgi:Rho guanine nucleotide exchange factor 17